MTSTASMFKILFRPKSISRPWLEALTWWAAPSVWFNFMTWQWKKNSDVPHFGGKKVGANFLDGKIDSKSASPRLIQKYSNTIYWYHRHCSLVVVVDGGPATVAEYGGKSIHLPSIKCQSLLCFGYCSWQQRQAGQANEQSTSLRCLWLISIY